MQAYTFEKGALFVEKLNKNLMHDYQLFCVDFIKEHPACGIFLDCGLGKSIIALSVIWDLALDSFDIGKILVVAPKRVAENTWPQEMAKWEHLTGLSYSMVLGNRKRRETALGKKASVYIINRENVAWLVDNYEWDFDTVVIDELSSFKSNQAQRFKALKKVRPKVRRMIGLTGTPAPNSLLDLWPQMFLLDMGQRLGRFIGGYRDRFFLPDKRSREIIYSYKPREGSEEKIYELISDICISMKAVDFLDMPEKISNRIEVVMEQKEQRLYDSFRREMCLSIGGEELDAVNAAGLSNKLLQMANGAVYGEGKKVLHIHDRKLDALEDLIEAANGKPLLVAYWYRHDLARIRERFDVRTIDTEKDIADWNAGKIPVALIHPASAGHGLNLQEGGSAIVWFGLTWSLELYQQLNARLWRQGQKNTVVIQHIITSGTHDEDVVKALERKDTRQSALIAAVKARIGGAI
jgi:SNF2 family DNA or RNA helicase